MALYQTRLDLIPELKMKGSDTYIVGTLPEMLDRCAAMTGVGRNYANSSGDWSGGLGLVGAVTKARDGDLSGVAKSDALLTKYENLAPVTRKMKTVASVAGGCPNVGAYLAGSPVAMRRRQRMMDEVGPLAIVVDTTCSSGITHEALTRRGAAILALVRLLALSRPVTLHVGCSIAASHSARNSAVHMYAQIDTAPLDVARSAHVLSHPSFNRALMYGLALETLGGDTPVWPYGHNASIMTSNAHKILGRVIQGEEFLFVGAAYLDDDLVLTNPEQWLVEKLKRYGASDDMDEAAEAA